MTTLITRDPKRTIQSQQQGKVSGNLTSTKIFLSNYNSATTYAPTSDEYKNILLEAGASLEFAEKFADRITSTDSDYEVIGT
jgi:hypothetical protein